MNRTIPRRLGLTLGVVALVGLLVIPSVATASATPSIATSIRWAYGGSNWTNASGSGVGPNGTYSYSIRAYFGVQVLFSQTNTSATTYELTANRTMLGAISATYCRPNCASPTASAHLALRAWEVVDASANFTTTAIVVGPTGHGQVPALGILNSSVRSTANFTELAQFNLTGPLGVHSASGNLGVRASERASLEFSPALGLVPDNLTSTPQWTSTSAYIAGGTGSLAYRFARTPFAGLPVTGGNSSTLGVTATGDVTVHGAVRSQVLLNGGLSTTAIQLAVTGPFSLREGFMLLPTAADLFGGHPSWASHSDGAQSASTDSVDYRDSGSSHIAIDASSTTYSGSTTDVNSASPALLGTSPADGTGPRTIQAQPETAAEAGSQGACLLSGTCAPTGGNGPARVGFSGAVLVGVALVGLIAVVVGLLVARQPPRRDPPTPNSNLYPPGATAAPRPSGRAAAPVLPVQDDPLGHLW